MHIHNQPFLSANARRNNANVSENTGWGIVFSNNQLDLKNHKTIKSPHCPTFRMLIQSI